jgi:cobalamin biosynthesis Mg chelatase CobN
MLTPVTVQTITVKSGTVWHVMGNNVILTLPNGENRQFIVKDDTRFAVNGNPATVHDLAKGMVVYAEKVVEEPLTELTTNTRVVGEAPPPAVAAAAASTSVPASAPTPAAAQPTPVESTSAAPQGTPAESAPAPVTQAPATAEAPSRMPLIVGLLLVAVVLVVWMLSRRKA